MNKKFTKLLAALALLVFMTPTMVGWGQTRTVQTSSYGFESGDAGWTATSFVTNNTAITAHGGSKYGATNGSSTANVAYNTIVANPQSLTCYYSKTTTNNNAGSHFEIQVSTNNSTWTKVAEGLGMDKVTKGTWYELKADLSSYTNVYVRVYYTGTSAVRALDDITLTYDDGNTPSTDPEITFTPTSITLDEVLVGNQVSTTFSVSQANLTSGITLSVDNGSLSPSSIAQGAAATTVTWTYTPTTAGAISATVTATSGGTTETLAISGTAIAPVEGYDVDFEYVTNMYPNWTFDNMTTYQTGSITAHGGTYYGTTGGKASASITTESTVANPGTLTCYVSKQSGNTTSSTWYIQVSSDGSDWTDVKTQSATSMSQGSWTEFSADLSSYTDVYVRVYYSGSTAIRNIDDLTLTTVTPSPAVATTTTITAPNDFNTDLHNGTNAGTLSATVTVTSDGTPVSGATVTWSSSNTGVATIDANGAVTLVAVGTTTITANYAGVEDQYRPSEGTYELTVIDSYAPGTVNNPYTVAQAIANTPSSGNVYIQGIVSSFYNTSIIGDGSNYRYYISDDGTTTTQLLVYKGKGLNQATFTNADDLLVGDEVVICGSLVTYQSAPEVASGNYLYSWNRPASTDPYITIESEAFELTAAVETGDLEIEYGNFTLTSFDIQSYDVNGVEIETPDWITLEIIEPTGDEGYSVRYTTQANEGAARIAYFKVYASLGEGLDDVYSNLVTITQAAPTSQTPTLAIGNPANVTITAVYGTEGVLANGESAPIPSGTEISLVAVPANGYTFEGFTVTDANNNTITLTENNGVYSFFMPNCNVTVSASVAVAPAASTYTLATSITSGKQYIIVGWADSKPYAMGYQKSNNRHAVEISVDGNTATATIADTQTNAYEFTITSLGEGYYSIEDATGSTGGYLYAAGSDKNHLKTESTITDNSRWEITVDDETGLASVVATNSSNRNVMRFNHSDKLFACYGSASQHPVYFYEKVEPSTFELPIAAGQWYLISSPVGTIDLGTSQQPTNNVGNLTTGTYGLYTFDQEGDAEGKEWFNFKAGAFNQLQAGTGYLYINQGGCTLTFTGTPYTSTGEFLLDYSTTNATTTFHGLNLVGNPYAQSAAIDHDYYIMNANGTDLTPYQSGDIVPAMQGVFVKATEEGQYVTFTPSQSATGGKGIEINLSQNRGAIVDRAIVRFGEGRQLSKVQLFDNSTKLYIPQNGKDYAIVSTEAQGELPVNFSASENGTYTLSMDVKNMDVNYLHLIDNMTGMDVDLLQTPSYTFEATTTDYESRFRLVFASNNANTDSDNFAFFSNGNLIINNEGNATLQVIDLNGRILSSESVNGSVSTTLNATPGVYMLRLINGENVKVQKIVVR